MRIPANKAVKPGRVHQITSTANPRIKAIRGLALKKQRDESGTFLVEGLKLVRDAFDLGWQVEVILTSSDACGLGNATSGLAANVRASGGDVLEVSPKLLSTITRKENPQNVIAVVRQKWANPPSRIADKNTVWIGLDRVRDPGNLGTIVRTADAAGVEGIILIGDTTDPYSFEATRASMGSIFSVALARQTPLEFLEWRTSWPGIVVGTHLEGATDFRNIDYRDSPVLLLMGNEQQGLPAELARACDHLALIPMAGAADSLNLAIATGVMLFHMGKRLPPTEQKAAT